VASGWGQDGLLGLRKVKIFKESFLEDKEFIPAILASYSRDEAYFKKQIEEFSGLI